MKHIYLNLKRFDVPTEFGGVNRIAPVADWAEYIVKNTQDELKKYDRSEVEFAMYFPEVHLLNAAKEKSILSGIIFIAAFVCDFIFQLNVIYIILAAVVLGIIKTFILRYREMKS